MREWRQFKNFLGILVTSHKLILDQKYKNSQFCSPCTQRSPQAFGIRTLSVPVTSSICNSYLYPKEPSSICNSYLYLYLVRLMSLNFDPPAFFFQVQICEFFDFWIEIFSVNKCIAEVEGREKLVEIFESAPICARTDCPAQPIIPDFKRSKVVDLFHDLGPIGIFNAKAQWTPARRISLYRSPGLGFSIKGDSPVIVSALESGGAAEVNNNVH